MTLDPTGKAGPGFLNLWRGFAVEPNPAGDASWFLDHLEMLLSPESTGSCYVTRWLASEVQNPGERGQTVVVLRGDQGTGKSFVGHAMRALFGVHALHIANSSHLVNKFNAHLLHCLFLHCDEALFAGDHSHDRILKSLVTEDVLMIEPKGVDAIQQRNRLAVLMTSNESWVVPAGPDARRYAVFDVSDAHQNDPAYWRPLWSALKDPAKLGGLLHHLLTRNLDGFNVRAIPNTRALREQRIQSQPLDVQWLMERLTEGRLLGGDDLSTDFGCDPEDGGGWPEFMPTSALYSLFESWCRQRTNARYMPPQPMFAKTLARIFGPPTRPRKSNDGRRPRGYTIGPLRRGRALFAAGQGLVGHEW